MHFASEPTILHLHEWKSWRLHTVAPSWHRHSIPYWYARTIITDCWGAVKDADRWYGWPIWLTVSTSLCALYSNTAFTVNQSVCRVSRSSLLCAVTDSISLKDAAKQITAHVKTRKCCLNKPKRNKRQWKIMPSSNLLIQFAEKKLWKSYFRNTILTQIGSSAVVASLFNVHLATLTYLWVTLHSRTRCISLKLMSGAPSRAGRPTACVRVCGTDHLQCHPPMMCVYCQCLYETVVMVWGVFRSGQMPLSGGLHAMTSSLGQTCLSWCRVGVCGWLSRLTTPEGHCTKLLDYKLH